jgi:hypothetical protein
LGDAGQLWGAVLEQLEAAARSTGGVDGHTRAGERLDVAQHGPFADLESSRELGGGHPPMPLKNEHQGDQPTCSHQASIARPLYS